ncbi:MAG: Asp-tRNA(Asn)/Glu-tRNA(Gln) amidotransferase subunit GatC [Myxococcales bacterium]|nr:Asp-tRNA(Asn)/Glu-tRNA(Gln) amidotransferase subunit GatC [Myxococcales bacterium]MDH5308002.1 Asp-tRNA(Asn)/Glu-tRNA(Gln) amidotransferase subunit GatC [Myxococcales bacterium]MDH5567442.1 Asp-tRNA(Asn)/Glu-tRNA(Gln) amidotransferase subunit GatC [Myxococcales bacterium]
MAHITRDGVERVVALARLSLSEPELGRMADELEAILSYVETLSRLDTEGVPPTSHVLPLATPLREDRALPPLDPDLAVANAPEHEGSAFVVPKVIEGEEEG